MGSPAGQPQFMWLQRYPDNEWFLRVTLSVATHGFRLESGVAASSPKGFPKLMAEVPEDYFGEFGAVKDSVWQLAPFIRFPVLSGRLLVR